MSGHTSDQSELATTNSSSAAPEHQATTQDASDDVKLIKKYTDLDSAATQLRSEREQRLPLENSSRDVTGAADTNGSPRPQQPQDSIQSSLPNSATRVKIEESALDPNGSSGAIPATDQSAEREAVKSEPQETDAADHLVGPQRDGGAGAAHDDLHLLQNSTSLGAEQQRQLQPQAETLMAEGATRASNSLPTSTQHNLIGQTDVGSNQPEYTILTPVTPMRTTATSAPTSQPSIMQGGAPVDPHHQVPLTPTATTILTDLDSIQHYQQQDIHHQQQQPPQPHHYHEHDSNNNNDGSKSSTQELSQHHQATQHNPSPSSLIASHSIKIDSSSQPNNSTNSPTDDSLGPPTLRELTSVPPHSPVGGQTFHTIHHHHHHTQPADLHAGIPHHHHLIGDDLHLLGGPAPHHTELLTSQQQQQQVPLVDPVSYVALPQQQSQPPMSSIAGVGVSQASNSSACSSSSANASGGRGAETPASLSSGSTMVVGANAAASSAQAGGEATAAGGGSTTAGSTGSGAGGGGGGGGGGKRRSWSQVNRNLNKSEIAKVYSQYGFRCYLETPISTCRRKEEDRITYINKGEFYGLTLEYVPDPHKALRSPIVKTVVMLVFREEKSPEEDLKSWQFWHSRQHSAKQRILDADNKNHVNVINQIEEVSLNAIAFYWNPIETRSAKLNVAIQCLSTDFSNQKGVKGLPLNLQVDIYDLFTETSTPVYRGYATLLSYCDKGAQRRSRDEERRAMKRKLADTSASGSPAGPGGATPPAGGNSTSSGGSARKFEELYHKPCDRSEFYSMADLIRAPTLYSPSEDALIDGPKQPMSQSSGVSLTPISATTPIPSSIDGMTQYGQQAAGNSALGVAAAQQLPPPPASMQQQSGQQQQQQVPPTSANQVIQTSGPTNSAQSLPGGRPTSGIGPPPPPIPQSGLVGPPPPMPPHSSYSLMQSDYMGHPQPMASGGPSIPVLAGPQQQQQQPGQSPLGMMGLPMGGQAQSQGHMMSQQQQAQFNPQAQHQHQQQGQQQHHHYHAMGGAIQGAYGMMGADPHHQQYAISTQGSMIPMGAPPHHHQHHHQQLVAGNLGGQHQMEQRGQQHQQQPLMMGQAALHQQQSGQQQQQQVQYQQPAVGLSATSAPMGQAQYNKRPKLYPDERVLIYAKQADEKDFYPLHLSPPSLSSLVYAIEQKYKIDSSKVANIYKKSKKGIRVQMDDEMIRHYCNEDMVQLEVIQTSDSRLEITLVEL